MISFLNPLSKYLTLITLVGGLLAGSYTGYKVRDVLADRTEAIQALELVQYKADVALSAAEADARALDLIHQWSAESERFQAKFAIVAKQRAETSKALQEVLANAPKSDDRDIGPALQSYVDGLRHSQSGISTNSIPPVLSATH